MVLWACPVPATVGRVLVIMPLFCTLLTNGVRIISEAKSPEELTVRPLPETVQLCNSVL